MASSKSLIITVKSNYVTVPFPMDSIIALTYAVKGTNINEIYGSKYNHLNIYAIPITEIPNNWVWIRRRWLSGPLYSHLDYYLMIKKNLFEEKRLKEMDKYLSIPNLL